MNLWLFVFLAGILECISEHILLQINSAERAQSIFGNLDLDGNGQVTEDEFVKGCMEDRELVDTMSGERTDHEEVCDEED